jgi:tetraacyldisaccharide 4'-kinase
MQSPGPENRTGLEKCLYVASRLYRAGISLRNKGFEQGVFPRRRLPCPVVAVGNLAAGGSGKTPMTLYLAEVFAAEGRRPVVISRGYGGKKERQGCVVSDGARVLAGPEAAGDEPYMMALQLKKIPVLVGADRYRAGCLAVHSFCPDVILLDDAFQHRRLHRDVNLLLVDAATGLGNGHLLPRGILREPPEAAGRADAVILTRSEQVEPEALAALGRSFPAVPVFRSGSRSFVYKVVKKGAPPPSEPLQPGNSFSFGFLKGRRVLGFSGIARNTDFMRFIGETSGKVLDFLSFPDHYRYRREELEAIARRAKTLSADYILTTQKDYARIPEAFEFPADLAVVGVSMDFGENTEAFSDFLRRMLHQAEAAD